MFRRLASWLGLLSAISFTVGCTTPGFPPTVAAPAGMLPSTRPFSPVEQTLAVSTIREWHRHQAVPGMRYELDPYDRRIGRSLRTALRDICPPLPPAADREDTTLFTISIDRTELPADNYGFAVIRVSNRFDAEEHAYVYAGHDQQWTLLDHYLIAKGLMDVVLVDFSWFAYCREKGIDLPAVKPGRATP